MSDSWEDREDEPDYSMLLPFLDESASFTLGFEAGSEYGKMRYSVDAEYEQTVHSQNQRQLLMAAKVAGWTLTFEPLDEIFSVMHARRNDV